MSIDGRVRRRVPLTKRVREAVSLALWIASEAPGAAQRALRARRTAPPATSTSTRAERGGSTPPRRRPAGPGRNYTPIALHAVALVLLVALVVPALVAAGLRTVAPAVARIGAWSPLEQASTVAGADGRPLAMLSEGGERRTVPLADVPVVLRQAVVAAEDRTFWTHQGYDAAAVARAALANLHAGRVRQGASTITQQLAKLNFVGSAPTATRKAKELLYAVSLEKRFTKPQLLERYVNQVYFGSGAYGVAAAAGEFFGTGISKLSTAQAALLAGLIRAPTSLDPRAHPQAATARRNEVLRSMVEARYLSRNAAAAAAASPLGLVSPPPAGNADRDPARRFVVEAVKREFLANKAFGPTEEARRRLLMTGGLRIETSIDPRLQDAAQAATQWVPSRLGSALVAVDPRTGRIAALYNGGAAATGQFDVATQGTRQPGSTFKPLVAAAALEAGLPASETLDGDGPIDLDYPGAPQPWRVDNFDGEDYGPVDMQAAVVNSVNTAFAQLGVAVGPQRIADVAQRVGVDVNRDLGPPASRGPSIALGGLTKGVSPLEMASAYATFAAGGTHAASHLIDRVVDPSGKELYRAQAAPAPVVAAPVNDSMVGMLKAAVSEGTGGEAALPDWDVLGKTGTSDGPGDGWFVGAVPVLSAAVWVGHPDSETAVPGLTGGAVSAPIWRLFMAQALTGQTPVPFPAGASGTPSAAPGSVAAAANQSPVSVPVARPAAEVRPERDGVPH